MSKSSRVLLDIDDLNNYMDELNALKQQKIISKVLEPVNIYQYFKNDCYVGAQVFLRDPGAPNSLGIWIWISVDWDSTIFSNAMALYRTIRCHGTMLRFMMYTISTFNGKVEAVLAATATKDLGGLS